MKVERKRARLKGLVDFVERVWPLSCWGITEGIKQGSVLKIWPFRKITVGKTPLLICIELSEKHKFKMLDIFKKEH